MRGGGRGEGANGESAPSGGAASAGARVAEERWLYEVWPAASGGGTQTGPSGPARNETGSILRTGRTLFQLLMAATVANLTLVAGKVMMTREVTLGNRSRLSAVSHVVMSVT